MSTSIPPNPTPHNVAALLPKLRDADPDIRFMTLNDLHQMLTIGSPSFLQHDYSTCTKVVDGLLQTLVDSHGDVQNQAVKCLGPFVNRAPETILCPTIEKVSSVKTDSTIDNTVPALAVRAIVVALPHPAPGVARTQKVQEAYNAISKALIPRLVGKIVVSAPNHKPALPPKGMLEHDLETGIDSNSLDLLAEVAKSFGPMLQEAEVEALENITMRILESDKCGSVMSKKAVVALSCLAPFLTEGLLARHISYTIEKFRQPHLTSQQRKLYLSVYGSTAKAIPHKFGPYLKTLAPFVLSPLSQLELEQQRQAEAEAEGDRDLEIEEVREVALAALELFLQSCYEDMQAYATDVAEASIRFIKYDPTLADDDDDEEMDEDDADDEFDAEEDFEAETGFDDEDDISWKVRRGSAKVLHALVAALDPNDKLVYSTIAPALLARFKEREESVRNEVLAALAFLISKTGAITAHHELAQGLPQNRKRRRGGSDAFAPDILAQQSMLNGYASPSTPPPTEGATIGLANLNPEIVKGAAKLLKTSTASTKLAVITLLKDMVIAQHGGLSHHVEQVIDPVVEALNTAQSSGSNVTGNAIRIESLALLRALAETHSSRVLQAHLDSIVPALIKLAKDRYARVSGEAFGAIEAFIKAMTPPRSAASNSKNGRFLTQFLNVILERIQAQDTDTEVKQKAIQALGLLVGRTSGSAGLKLLSQSDRFQALEVLLDRMRNELTRLATVRAFDTVAVLAQNQNDYKPGLADEFALELAAQLRKASRSLRGASLSALRMLAANNASRDSLADDTIVSVVESLIPLIQPEDLHMLGPALVILTSFAEIKPQLVSTPACVAALCQITSTSLSGNALEALINCVEVIGRAGNSPDLMTALLQQGVSGDTDVTGRVIGALLVAGGKDSPVALNQFVEELQTSTDEHKKCLALSVLGEAAQRLGTTCPLKPENFTPYFNDSSEKVKLAAAVALGRAGAGNVKVYLAQILDAMAQGRQYLLLHSVKELLQHSKAEDDIKPFAQSLWEHIINSGQAEDNKVVSAECIGRLAIIDPVAYLPQLQKFLGNPKATIRGMVITALRYVFSDTDDSYNINLQASIIPMLSTMLSDQDLDNQRLALSAFNSAFQNKAALVVPQLSELLPHAMSATVIRPELVREVSMGPFKHKVDDGLEIRKSAYETLYGLLENRISRQRLDVPSFYDRIIAGINDEHEIKIVCCLILSKLVYIAKDESIRRLEALAGAFRTVVSFKPKDNAVKQELEKLAEQNKALIRVSIQCNKAIDAMEESRAWRDYFEWVKKEMPVLYKAAEEDVKDLRDH
ncbi:hypothetical protein AMS68_000207 [Peltaster fructicola]|uniref:TATA-binding protein interacting (TIP20) domain-containing protein n=1 Tax=Peltaster fructicola TaxID=286661 RepID=A0A6H0XJI7_9PEZI|nr:hypothetical protein AMS68_000207 [Peltaster fructicola]